MSERTKKVDDYVASLEQEVWRAHQEIEQLRKTAKELTAALTQCALDILALEHCMRNKSLISDDELQRSREEALAESKKRFGGPSASHAE